MPEQASQEIAVVNAVGLFEALPKPGETVYDQATHEQVEITVEDQALAIDLHNRVFMNVIDTACAVSQIHSRRLYVQLGYNHFNEYVEKSLPFGTRQAYSYVLIGARLEPRLLTMGADSTGAIAQIGMAKLKTLTENISDADLDKFVKGEEFMAADGTMVSIDKLTEKSVRDWKEKFKGATTELGRTKADLETTKKELADALKSQSGDTTVAQELATKLEKVTAKFERLQGERKKAEQAEKQLAKASEEAESAYQVLLAYSPRSAEDYEASSGEMDTAIAIAVKYQGLFARLVTIYNNIKSESEGA